MWKNVLKQFDEKFTLETRTDLIIRSATDTISSITFITKVSKLD